MVNLYSYLTDNTIEKVVMYPNAYKAGTLYSIYGDDFTSVRASNAYRLNNLGNLELMGNNVPRCDYSNGTCPELLVEKESENVLLYSRKYNEFPEWNFNSVSFNPSGTLSLDGTNNAFEVVEDSGVDEHYFYQNFTFGGTELATGSIIAKANTRDVIYLYFLDALGNRFITWFDLSNGQVLTNNDGNIANIKLIADGWYLCEISNTLDFNAGSSSFTYGLSTADAVTSYNGDGTSGAYFDFAQLELGDYATSRINTTTTTVTRPRDVIHQAVSNTTELTLYAEVNLQSGANSANDAEVLVSLNDGSTDLYLMISATNTNEIVVQVYNDPDIYTYTSDPLPDGSIKVGVLLDTTDIKIFLGGIEVVDDAHLIGLIAYNRLDLGSIAGSLYPVKDTIKSVIYFDTMITEQEMIDLTL